MINNFSSEILKWFETIKMNWEKVLTYRLDFFLQLVVPPITFLLIKLALWKSIYGGNPETTIGGYSINQMISYHAWVFLITRLTTSHYSINIAEDIRMGRITVYLLYPFSFSAFHTAGFIAHQVIQLGMFFIGLIVFYALGLIELPTIFNFTMALSLVLLVGFFWFSLQFFSGILGFWLEETWMLRVMLFFLSNLLGGAIIPLDLFPAFWLKIINFTPFPLLTFIPIQWISGRAECTLDTFIILFSYLGIMLGINSFIFKRGIRLYNGGSI